MRLEDLSQYVASLDHLTKFEMKSEDDTMGHFLVTETKETYVYEDEESADEKISVSVEDPNCAGHSKKYKQGKVNKSGEIVKPETWTVIIKLNH